MGLEGKTLYAAEENPRHSVDQEKDQTSGDRSSVKYLKNNVILFFTLDIHNFPLHSGYVVNQVSTGQI